MRVLVTGAAGFIGSSLCLKLVESGFRVSGLDSFDSYYSPAIKRGTEAALAKEGIRIHELDLAADGLGAALAGIDAVVHLAGQPGISAATRKEDYERNNILATRRLLESARAAGVGRFVNVSSSSVYGIRAMDAETTEPKPASWYGESKLAAESEAMRAHRDGALSACSLRLFSVYGERERPEKLFPRLIRAIGLGEEFSLFEGSEEHRRSFTYVGDVCDGILVTLANWSRAAGEIFNLGTDRSVTTGEAIRTVEEIMGRKAKINVVPARSGDQMATHANIDKIRSTLGWEPKTSLREGLERVVKGELGVWGSGF